MIPYIYNSFSVNKDSTLKAKALILKVKGKEQILPLRPRPHLQGQTKCKDWWSNVTTNTRTYTWRQRNTLIATNTVFKWFGDVLIY